MIRSVGFTNYKGYSREHRLGRLNIVSGRNGSGKTAIYEAIHIALKGKHPYLGETLQAIKKQCSGNPVTFSLVTDSISIDREISFGDKTVHTVCINGNEAKVKEAQAMIDEKFSDSLMRLDIGKFSKMNDIERGIVLSDLLGSVKLTVKEIALDVLDAYYRQNPESEYVLKYRLGKESTDKYDKREFVNAMSELYKDKNPVILEMVSTAETIIAGIESQDGEVQASEALDFAFEAVKKFRNAKAQEKQYAQKTFAEISSDSIDPREVERGLKTTSDEISGVDDKIRALRSVIDTLKAIRPSIPLDGLDDKIMQCEKTLKDNDIVVAECLTKLSELDALLGAINEQEEGARKYDQWESIIAGYKNTIDGLETTIKEYSGKIQPESKHGLKSLEAAKVAYMSMKELTPGECPLCGTLVTEEAASERRAKKKAAKQAYDEAVSEIKLRQENSFIEAKIELAKKQLKEAKENLARAKEEMPAKPKIKPSDLQAEKNGFQLAGRDLTRRMNAAKDASAKASYELATAKAEKDKHTKYAAAVREHEAIVDIYSIDLDDPQTMVDALSRLETRRNEINEQYINFRAAELLNERLANDQQRILDLQTAADTLGSIAEIIREYKNEVVQRKIEPVRLLAKKYYHDNRDDIVITPKTIGVMRDDSFIEQSAMSAGEALSLMSSVLIAIMESSGTKPTYLFVDAAEIDTINMVTLMGALEKSSIDNIILAHHTPVSFEGWVEIRL